MFLILLMLIFDIWNHYSYTSVLGYKYFLTLIDNYSRFIWVILVKFKEPLIIGHLKSFGCLCYISTLYARRTKFNHRSRKNIFIGLHFI